MSDNVERSLGRIEGKMDLILANMATHAEDDITRFSDISKRLTVIEGWRYQALGGAAVMTVVGGLLMKVFLK